MSYAHYLKEIASGEADLPEREAQRLFGAMLDGGVPELELGALLLALQMKRMAYSELSGFANAVNERLFRLTVPTGKALPVVLPSYGCSRFCCSVSACRCWCTACCTARATWRAPTCSANSA